MSLESAVNEFQNHLRAFAFGELMDREAARLLERLGRYRRRRADVEDRVELKALALVAEYLDAHGRAEEAAELLKLTVEEILTDGLASEDLKLARQRVWCCLAYALAHLRADRTREAGEVLRVVGRFVNEELVREDFPCHGTVALLRYYEGLWHRNEDRLDAAARAFDAALDQTRLRYEEKQAKYQGVDAERLRRELVYHRVMTARILGFGQGGIALARGRYLEARSWLIGASQILAQLGQEHWRKALEVYARSAAVLVAELEQKSAGALEREAVRLRELEKWFASRNLRNGLVAGAFGVLAEIRQRQIRSGDPRSVDLTGLEKRVEQLLRAGGADSGPLSGNAVLALVEVLVRAGRVATAERYLERMSVRFATQPELRIEMRMIEAQLLLAGGDGARARALLEALLNAQIPQRGHRARAWLLLAECEQEAGRRQWAERAIEAAREAAEAAQDGYTRALVEAFRKREPLQLPMPYQSDSDRWCDMDFNLEMARLNVVAAAHERHPEMGVEQLATLLGRGTSWLYELLGRHREVEWVRRLVAIRSK